MKPFTTTAYWADACTPDNVIPGCTIAETEDGDLEITVNSREGLFNLIHNITGKIHESLQWNRDHNSSPHDDKTQDISNALDLLNDLSSHLED